ncbi:hypothetical protein BGX38DRAFT_575677 [Terfezia claveryi]|nr:hypothetical protein BGX38DRAFT_575677 [Terfezia claveryi]
MLRASAMWSDLDENRIHSETTWNLEPLTRRRAAPPPPEGRDSSFLAASCPAGCPCKGLRWSGGAREATTAPCLESDRSAGPACEVCNSKGARLRVSDWTGLIGGAMTVGEARSAPRFESAEAGEHNSPKSVQAARNHNQVRQKKPESGMSEDDELLQACRFPSRPHHALRSATSIQLSLIIRPGVWLALAPPQPGQGA